MLQDWIHAVTDAEGGIALMNRSQAPVPPRSFVWHYAVGESSSHASALRCRTTPSAVDSFDRLFESPPPNMG